LHSILYIRYQLFKDDCNKKQ